MRRGWIGAAMVVLSLSACVRPADRAARQDAHGRPGRYIGIGLYAPGRMWTQLIETSPSKTPAASTLKDDDQVIVVEDSATGELRQCGNLSGYCVTMNPWAGSLAPSRAAPVRLSKHAEDLDREAAAAGKP